MVSCSCSLYFIASYSWGQNFTHTRAKDIHSQVFCRWVFFLVFLATSHFSRYHTFLLASRLGSLVWKSKQLSQDKIDLHESEQESNTSICTNNRIAVEQQTPHLSRTGRNRTLGDEQALVRKVRLDPVATTKDLLKESEASGTTVCTSTMKRILHHTVARKAFTQVRKLQDGH